MFADEGVRGEAYGAEGRVGVIFCLQLLHQGGGGGFGEEALLLQHRQNTQRLLNQINGRL